VAKAVYRHPNSAFVANFIGTMNVVDGHISGQGKVCCGSLEFDCDSNGASVGTGVTLAIRPEDITLDSSDDGHDNVVTVRVTSVDFLGPFYCVSFAAGTDQTVMFRADIPANLARHQKINPGTWLHIRLPKDHLRMYLAEVTHG
jgi:iron(III) transport system ATP-binding protein